MEFDTDDADDPNDVTLSTAAPISSKHSSPSRDQKMSAVSQTVATARIAPHMCQVQPQHLAVQDFIQIGPFSAKL